MNINRENKDDLNAVLNIRIEKPDYEENVDKTLNDYRKKAHINGFRPGKVPMGLVRRMYYKPVLMDEIHKVLTEAIASYFKESNLFIIGEPLPNEDKELPEINWDEDTEFDFAFDIGLAPEIDFSPAEGDKIPYYGITVGEDAINEYKEQVKTRFGSFSEVPEITGNELLKTDLREVDAEGNAVEGGIVAENRSINLEFVQDQETKDKFSGLKSGDKTVIDVKKAFTNETDLAALLGIKKEDLPALVNNFEVTVNSVTRFAKADITPEIWDKMYGKDQVKNEDDFRVKIIEEIKAGYEKESNYRFRIDAREFYMNRFVKDIPDEFYKRWILHVNEEKLTAEQLEKDYPEYRNDLKWQLIKNKFSHDFQVEVTEPELKNFVSNLYRAQFAQYYGIARIPDDMVNRYADEALGNENEKRKFRDMVVEDKIFESIKAAVKPEPTEISWDDFKNLYEKKEDTK